ncbi:MAG TPA: bifunctional histidinol-phosphatase/imidazoleglycerol-phosphate dehydratase HisB [Steroidobacteraceae bacterium]|nr:bifunctional histidinol-phosphatase/imidazoleglycerol-phosphate dehydratase HisB [Steroidobacteraceae bacterium]
MSTPVKAAFVDRDGTIVEEPPDEQVDSLEKIRFMPGVVPALLELERAGFTLVMVTNQNGIGTLAFPQPAFRIPHDFILRVLDSQGIRFAGVYVCPHLPEDNCACRKPKLGMLTDFLARNTLDHARSVMIGDRDTDLEFAANLGVTGYRVSRSGPPDCTWPAICRRILESARTASVERATRETRVQVSVALDHESPIAVTTGLGFFDHMIEQIARHGGFSLALTCQGDLKVDEHHTVEDCALALGAALRQALGDKRGIARYGFVLPMDEARAQVAVDLSARPYFVFEGKFPRDRVGELPTELVPHFFRSLADSLGAAIHLSVTGENTHHMVEACFKGVGRALRQAIRVEGSELPSSKGTL